MKKDRAAFHLGRGAGLTYLVMIVSAAGGYTTMTKLLAGSPEAVLSRIAGSNTFAFAFAAMALGFIAWIVLAVLLYRLMGAFGRLAGVLMLAFTLAGAAVNLIALSNLFPIVSGAGAGLDAEHFAQMRRDYEYLLVLAQVFSGLWMFPFGWLVLRSGVVPRLLGYCLMIGGIGYLFIPLTKYAPHLDQNMAYWLVSHAPGIPAMVGEIGVCLWLLVKGAEHTRPRPDARAAEQTVAEVRD